MKEWPRAAASRQRLLNHRSSRSVGRSQGRPSRHAARFTLDGGRREAYLPIKLTGYPLDFTARQIEYRLLHSTLYPFFVLSVDAGLRPSETRSSIKISGSHGTTERLADGEVMVCVRRRKRVRVASYFDAARVLGVESLASPL